MKNAKTSHPILDYLLVLCSLFCFGFKIFQYNSRAAFAILAIACLAALLTRGARAGLKPGRILLLLPVAALLLARLVLFSDHLFITFTLNVILAAMICARVGRDYYRYYYRWLVFFSATSLFFFLLQNIELTSWIQRDLVPLFAVEEPETHREMAYTIFIHNFSVSKTAQRLDLYRNNGPFWEPGLFGGFLAIALHVSLFIYKKKILTLPNLLLLAAILTTFSTGAYILLAIILASFYLKKILARPRYIVIATLLAIALLAAYSNLEFMQVKIQEQELHARQMSINEMKSARDMPRLAFFAMHLSLVSSTFSNTLLGVDFSWMEHAVATPYVVCGISAVFLYFGFFVGAYYLLLIIVAAARAPRGSPGPHAWVQWNGRVAPGDYCGPSSARVWRGN